jgi:fructosamine-3-kinase
MRVAGLDLAHPTPVGGGDICAAWRATWDGRPVFVKTKRDAPAGFFAAEAAGLDRLRVDGGPPVPAVVACGDDGLVLQWIEPGRPSQQAARRFGAELAVLHGSGAPSYGAPEEGYIGSLVLPNAPMGDWPAFFADRRLRPYCARLSAQQRDLIEQVCLVIDDRAGPAEPPSCIHGDLWSGNLLWGADGRVWLVDAASAHGGHRETDLAMLALFGAPHLDAILEGYQSVAPLAGGWPDRVGLHQLHPLLVHATLFGSAYGDRAAAVARGLLSTADGMG